MSFEDAGSCVVGGGNSLTTREEELRRLRGMLDNAFAFIGLVALDGTLIDANHATVEGLGLKRADVIGKPLWDTHYWSHARCSREMMRDAVERAALGEVVRGDFIVRAGEEKFIVIDATFGPLRDAEGHIQQVVASAVDVTDRVAHADAARKIRHQLETAQRIASIGSWQWDFATGVLNWSAECYRLLGWDPNNGLATLEAMRAAVHPADLAAFDETVRRAVDGAAINFEHRVVRSDGQTRVVHQLGEVETDVYGKPARMIGTTRDVTELRTTYEELVEQKLRAEAASQTKSRFLANMSHELRTPLNAIIGFSEILLSLDDLSTDKAQEYLNDVHSSGKHLLSVINDILDISRIEAGKVDLREEFVPAGELIDAAQRMIRARAEDAGVDLHCSIGTNLPVLNVDRRLMMQTLLNFASNAVKFTERGGRVDMDARETAQGGAEIVVRDTGIGMSREDVARVGERFLQADGRLSRKYEGTGLGLVIAKRLIELHGGELTVQSELGKGTTMTIRMPPARIAKRTPLAAAS
jgi:PAS domain S-box-containing protein